VTVAAGLIAGREGLEGVANGRTVDSDSSNYFLGVSSRIVPLWEVPLDALSTQQAIYAAALAYERAVAKPTQTPAPVLASAPRNDPLLQVQGALANWADSERIICEGRAWDCNEALAVFGCESGLNPNAYNPSGSYVLAQIQWWWHRDKLRAVAGSDTPELLFDANINLDVAEIIYRDGGWSAWSCRYVLAKG